ncbi:hypothetical protein [Achromobacter deleyi]|uniref:hypothetical protein n=1 Tax=Achromobacter deleyi TaxID=1353891 RepID=UPI001468CCFD|nr:hypothetical protein [Achromobacter deleyi]CAB3928776.1 hypothetical protein LMG3412_06375 [Achromobacter deleyi]
MHQLESAHAQELRNLAHRIVVARLGEADVDRRARLLSRKFNRLAARFLASQRAKDEAQ